MNAPATKLSTVPGLADLKAAAEAPFEESRAMPPEVYTSQAFHDREIEAIFKKEWVCVGRADQLTNPGDYIAYELAGQPVFVIRDEAGDLNAYSNVCLHRMSTLLQGTGCAKRITCPYHGWTYGTDGRLKAAAAMKGNRKFDQGEYRLPRIRCENWLGWIMISLNPDAAPFGGRLAGLEAEIADLRMGDYVQSFYETFVWNTNWKVLAENFMESYHLQVCHAATIGGTTTLGDTTCPPGAPGYNIHSIVKHEGAKLHIAHENSPLIGERRLTTHIMSVYPGLFITLSPGYFWYLSLHPRGPGQVHVTFGGGMAPEFATDPAAGEMFAETKKLLDAVNDEDKECTERVYRGLSADLATPGHLSPLERPLYDFAGYLAGMMG